MSNHATTPAIALERRQASELTRATFLAEYANQRPVLIVDAARSWRASRCWNPAHLAEVHGDKLVSVNQNVNGTFDPNEPPDTGRMMSAQMSLREAIEAMLSPDGYRYYIQQQELRTRFPELITDLELPYLMTPDELRVANLWLGARGCKSPLHYDRSGNLFVQIFGTKDFTLFPPEHGDSLYPALGAKLPHISRVNAFAPNLAEFPRYADALRHSVGVRVAPSSLLYIPPGWWHAVETLEFSISVNHWYKQRPPDGL